MRERYAIHRPGSSIFARRRRMSPPHTPATSAVDLL